MLKRPASRHAERSVLTTPEACRDSDPSCHLRLNVQRNALQNNKASQPAMVALHHENGTSSGGANASDVARAPLLLSKKLRTDDGDEKETKESHTLRAAVWPAHCSPLFDSQRDEHAALGLSINTLKKLRLQVGVTVKIHHAGSDALRFAIVAALDRHTSVEDGAIVKRPERIPVLFFQAAL